MIVDQNNKDLIKTLSKAIESYQQSIDNYEKSFPTDELKATWSGMLKCPVEAYAFITHAQIKIKELKDEA